MGLLELSVFMLTVVLCFYGAELVQVCKLCKCFHDKEFGGLEIVCSNLSLHAVPGNINSSATKLFLDNNRLKSLPAKIFDYLTRLRLLDLSTNELTQLDENAFDGLSRLQVLNLERNYLTLDTQTYKPNVFKPLKQVLQLFIGDNSNNTLLSNESYPDESFSHLTSLETLQLDGLSADFGPGFARLSNLSHLYLSGDKSYCYIPILTNTMFVNVPNVQHLNVRHCQVAGSELQTFASLKLIKDLDLSDNRHLGFSRLVNATYGLQNSSIEVLKINRIYPYRDVCSHLKAEHVVYLKNTKLKELHIDENGLIGVDASVILDLSSSLQHVSARRNKFQPGAYMGALFFARSLKYIDVSGINKLLPWLIFKRSTTSIHAYGSLRAPPPPNLETVIIADCSLQGPVQVHGFKKNNLTKFVANKNFLTRLEGSSAGLDQLKYLDVSQNVIEYIQTGFFEKSIPITFLNLSNNYLGRALLRDREGYIFKNLTKVLTLDLSQNRISVLTPKLFSGLQDIENMSLSDNYLRSFDADISSSKRLSFLDLSRNKIQMFSAETCKRIENVSRITLKGNPISCTCLGLEFLRWMNANKARISDLESITCELSPGKEESFRNLETIIRKLDKKCHSPNTLAVSVSLSLFLSILVVICIGVGYRHRWKIRYLYHVGRRAYRQHHDVDNGDEDAYQYDVFVSYAAPDRRFVIDAMMPELETKSGLRMCIHDRDFLPGEVIATNIVNAIQNSRKTLIILSPSFLNSEWCEFEYNMARMEGVTRRQNIILIVLYKYVPLNYLPKDMSVMLRNNCYLEYNDDEFGTVVFWENIVAAINSNGLPE